ncbi:MAG: DUF3299 domain-containing protein [Planctomycetaceae bacterium]
MSRLLGLLVCAGVALFLVLQPGGGPGGGEADAPPPAPPPDRAGPGYIPPEAPTEAPEGPPPRPGAQRTDFDELSGYDYDPEADVIPDSILALHGKTVELKGVMYYGVDDPANVTEFHFMPNHYVCCFGTPRTNEIVKVSMKPGTKTHYLLNYYLVRGTLEVGAARDAKGRVLHLYRIRDAEVEILN